MAGEMSYISPEGIDSNGETWELHAELAKRLGGELKPFDVYQGPYIVIGGDIRVGTPPYALAVQGLGVVRLWLADDGGGGVVVYREDTEQSSDAVPCDHDLIEAAARSLLEPEEVPSG